MYTILSLSNPPCLLAIWNCLLNISSGFNYSKPIVNWISSVYWFFNTTSSRVNLLCDTDQIVLKLWIWALLQEKNISWSWPWKHFQFSCDLCSPTFLVVQLEPSWTHGILLFLASAIQVCMWVWLVLCLRWSLYFVGEM